MSKYVDLDSAILTAIAGGIPTFHRITARVAHIAKPFGKGDHDTFRVVDRRLQALRKSGLIVFEKKGWLMAGSLRAPQGDL